MKNFILKPNVDYSASSFKFCYLAYMYLVSLWTEGSNAINLPQNLTIPAVFTFGDSILDTGNNNNLNTYSKSNFLPYGRDFPGGQPTGRFCNGRVPSDLIAEALGVKKVLPAFLDPNLQNNDLPTGVGFASGGSGSDTLTASIQRVLTLPNQLDMFKQYTEKLKGVVGEEKAKRIISDGLFLVSSGNNDVAFTYPTYRRPLLPFPSYADQLVSWSSEFFKELYELGARRVGVFSTLPLGCLPGERTAGGGLLRSCLEISNQEAQLFNSKLFSAINSIKTNVTDFKLVFIDVYTLLLDIIQTPQKNGFQVVANGCCGGGTFEVGGTCNQLTPGTCTDASTHVFWDADHPAERAYQVVVSTIVQKYLNDFV